MPGPQRTRQSPCTGKQGASKALSKHDMTCRARSCASRRGLQEAFLHPAGVDVYRLHPPLLHLLLCMDKARCFMLLLRLYVGPAWACMSCHRRVIHAVLDCRERRRAPAVGVTAGLTTPCVHKYPCKCYRRGEHLRQQASNLKMYGMAGGGQLEPAGMTSMSRWHGSLKGSFVTLYGS